MPALEIADPFMTSLLTLSERRQVLFGGSGSVRLSDNDKQ